MSMVTREFMDPILNNLRATTDNIGDSFPFGGVSVFT